MKRPGRAPVWLGACLVASVTLYALETRSSTPVLADDPGQAAPAPGAPGAQVGGTSDMLGAMAMLAGWDAPKDAIDDWAHKLDAGTPLDSFIDQLVEQPRFSHEIVPALVFGSFVNVRNYYALPSGFTLKQTTDGATTIYYLRQPCALGDAVSVHPWWNLASEVKVCPDSYRPEKWILLPDEHSYRTRMPLSCDSQVGSPELEVKPLCGCGPNLIRCLRDDDQYNEFNRSLMDEVKQTTAYVVEHDLPIETLFTGNSSFRDRNVEEYYRRQKIGALHIEHPEPLLADLDKWPQDGQWAPREEISPGMHAGMLTAPQILHWLPDRRQRQRGYYEIMWCAMRNSFGATTKKVLELNKTGNLGFVHDSWSRMAHTELCMNCHARLDYGFQFFMGYPDSRAGIHFDPQLQSKDTGPLYGKDIHDLRGTGPLTPLGFAKLAVAQPEFKDCMAEHFVSYVFGDRATDDDRGAIQDAVASTGRFKAVMKVALERYAAKWRAAETTPVASAPRLEDPPLYAPAGMVTVGPVLRKYLDDDCVECHDEGKYKGDADDEDVKPLDFRGSELPRPLVVRMTDRVAFGMMPKDEPLDPAEREGMVTDLIDSLWVDPQARAEAKRYYLGRERGLPAHQIDNALYAVDHAAHAHYPVAWGALERGLWPDQATITPGFLTLTSLEALNACRQAEKSEGLKLEDCLDQATSMHDLSRWPERAP